MMRPMPTSAPTSSPGAPAAPSGSSSGAGRGGPEVTLVRADALTPGLLDEWRVLEAAAALNANPFLVPEWILSWYACYVPDPADQLVALVRHRKTGELVGLAPLHGQDLTVSRFRVARRLVPVGAGIVTALELPGYLAAPGQHRDVMRAVVEAVTALPGVDWAGAVIAPEQGWFEPEQLMAETAGEVDFWQHLRSRACVVLPLESTWEATQAGFKRNLKESLRRSRNRLEKSGLTHEVVQHTGADLDEDRVNRFLELHRDRAANDRATVAHPDSYSDPTSRALLTLALPQLAAAGRASVFELVVDGAVVASQLALHAPGSSYVHSSGFHPDAWEYGPVGHLHGALVRAAVERGDQLVNFSPGPRVSKLRWSEQVWVSSEFAFGIGSRWMMRRYLALRAASALRPGMSGVEWNPRSARRHG